MWHKLNSVILAAAMFGTLMFGAVDRARTDTIYYASNQYGTFGTLDSAGHSTTIGTGLSFGGGEAERLMFAPNGTLYAFDLGYAGGSGSWGTINPATGTFTQVGNLNTSFSSILGDHTETWGFSLAFGSSGNLYATGQDSGGNWHYGTLNLTTGAFTAIATSPVGYAGSIASPTPEPSTFVLLGAAAIALSGYRWRQSRAKP